MIPRPATRLRFGSAAGRATTRGRRERAATPTLLGAFGTPADIPADVVEILIASGRRFIASHGTAGLPNYVALVEVGVLPDAQDRVLIPGGPEAGAGGRAGGGGVGIGP